MAEQAKSKPIARVLRHSAERYDVYVGHTWAIIFVSEHHGVLSIVSDYGKWGYCWPNHGDRSLKHLLLRVHDEYLVRKFGGRGTDFDFDASVAALRKAIGRAYGQKRKLWYPGDRTEVFGKERCREAIEAIRWLDDTRSSADFARQVWERKEFDAVHDDIQEFVVMRDSGALCEFLEVLWPHFIAQIRAEVGG